MSYSRIQSSSGSRLILGVLGPPHQIKGYKAKISSRNALPSNLSHTNRMQWILITFANLSTLSMKSKYTEHFSLSKQWTWTPSTEGTSASRPEPLENALEPRFDQAVFCRATKTWKLLVDHHMTTSHQGPADKTLHRWMSIYTSNIRPHFAQEEEDQSFVKDDEQCFRSGTIKKRLTEIF